MAKTKIKDGYLVFDDENERPVHRWISERKYKGKENIENKEIHHINSDKLNNDETNLIALSKEDHFQITLHDNRIKFALDIIILLTFIFLVSIILGNLLMPSFIGISRICVLIIFLIAIELRFNFIGKAIRRPNSKIDE